MEKISDSCVCGRTGDIIQRDHPRIQINPAEECNRRSAASSQGRVQSFERGRVQVSANFA